MPTDSIRRVARARKSTPRYVRLLATLFSILALVVFAVTAWSLSGARALMRVARKPLANYSSTVMPSFSLASFRSLDGRTLLTGWLFQPPGAAKGTVVMVHDNGANRLQFDADTLLLYDFFLQRDFGVLSFDLSHAGESEGEFSTYGYKEWEDVVAALDYAWRNSVSDHLILFAWGSGCAASLLALDHIPQPGADRSLILPGDDSEHARMLRELPFDRGSVRAVLLDGLAATTEAYIRADLPDGWIDRFLSRKTIPIAMRMSSRAQGDARLIPILSQTQVPVLLIGEEGPDGYARAGVQTLIQERQRLHPDSTMLYTDPQAGYLQAFTRDPSAYLARLGDFFKQYLDHTIS